MAEFEPIDFPRLAEALLDRAEVLVSQWLQGGRRQGPEWVCADLGGGAGGSCSVNLVNGRWADFGSDERGNDLTSLYAAIHGLSQIDAARQLVRDLGWERSRVAAPAPSQASARAPVFDAAVPSADAEAPSAPGHAPAARKVSVWEPVVPVPDGTPAPDFKHWHHGAASAWWEYRFGDALYGYVVRYDKPDGRKEILPLTWCVDTSDGRGTRRWQNKQWDEPRPLFVPTTLLAEDPRLVPVVVVEGEKCAKAGLDLLGHEFDFVSWPGGGKAWAKSAWSWLRGRVVILWPDCDAKRVRLTKAEREAQVDPASKPLLPEMKQPGMQAMVAIGSHLVADMACQVSMCKIPEPGDVSDGWDLADAVAQGWTAETVREFIRGARTFVPPDDAARAKAAVGKSTPSVAGATPDDDAEAAALAWRERLLTAATTGAIKAVRENVVLALDGMEHPLTGEWIAGTPETAGLLAYNEFTNDVVKLRATPWGTKAGPCKDWEDLLMGEWLVRKHWLPSMARATLEEGIRMVAARHEYHPVRAYLRALKWDGEKRLATWLRRACLVEDEWDNADPLQRYLARVGTFFLMGMVARVLEPGVKFDYMLILEGRQGLGKSTLLRVLGGDHFADTGLVLGDKDSYQQLQGRWLYEFGELDSFSKTEVSKIKLFIASTSDYFRASFDRRARDYPRQVAFGGTTNEDHYLTDPTGNRRFWPVRVTRQIDLEWLRANRDQLFAEAVHRVVAGARMYPTPDEEIELFVPQQQQRTVENAIESAIARYLYPPQNATGANSDGMLVERISLVELLGKIGIGIEKLGPGRFHEKQAAAALRRLGWEEDGRASVGPRPRLYRRPHPGAGGSKSSTTAPRTQGDQPEGADDDCPF